MAEHEVNVQKWRNRVIESTEFPRGAPREIQSNFWKQKILVSNLRSAAHGHRVLNKLPHSDPLSLSVKLEK